MKISNNGLNLIKSFEGCRLTAYKCPAGVWTIGWGHTGDVVSGQTITQEEADQMLINDIVAYEKKVDKYQNVYNFNQNEYDALVSFAYNVGSIDQLTANGTRSKAVIADKLLLYTKGGGKVLPGLVRRREAERELFLTPIDKKEGWCKEGDKWRYYNDGTYLKNRWQLINHHWYYFDFDGYIMTGMVEIEGKKYYLEESGDYEGACWHEAADGSGALERWYVE